ncbi:hypothetical protein GLAREA_07423 [Glarea lozoyensis ATCC 20868]|uniref:Nucleotide-diphospho-sugar transferase n=1 Tax=Glarea lozoyensis (strain ATCC 20868 / MF5171) TaxID=1116229 RepID=S3D3G0_GLAL2|nr:uncharacterized protein GLAREA_07423 [Glarea lozoyensis ATCC 20868]EPE32290.1 hypothetical protein GLAREA_07423 [Glarea lozoyensis ATCC 20868]
MLQIRYKHVLLLSISAVFVVAVFFLREDISSVSRPIIEEVHDKISPPPELPKKPKYKETSSVPYPPVKENFPLAQAAHSAADLPPIPSWNAPPKPHVEEKTPLFIGFTRNWRVLQQVVVSYITAGWPAEDIYVIENTGVMDSNKNGLLSLQNPFFLNHTRLNMLGVNVIQTPTLFTFAQLQNFYLYTSIQKKWDYYFWSHMDIIVASYEDRDPPATPEQPAPHHEEPHKFRSVYQNCLLALRKTLALPKTEPWAMRFFSYDRLALVNVQTFIDVGGWDTLIPFYTTDCDMHFRLSDSGYSIEEVPVGMVYDVAASLDDLVVMYRQQPGSGPGPFKVPLQPTFKDPNVIEAELQAIADSEAKAAHDGLNSTLLETRQEDLIPRQDDWHEDTAIPSPSQSFLDLLHTYDAITASKHASSRGRNTWQARATGGKGEPFYRDSAGFETGIQMTIEHGRRVFGQKWGHRDCDLPQQGLHVGDEWRVVQDWE